MNKTILVLGGDGFCGWATSLHLSKSGYHVIIVDNLSRRKIDIELGVESLTPIATIEKRLATWKEVTSKDIDFINIDIAKEYELLLDTIVKHKPLAIVHFAEQRAAPYSMRSSKCKRYTVDNNLNATHNVLCAIVESGLDIHLVHLGSMGVYGYETINMPIPEGYLPITITNNKNESVKKEILYPPSPGSVYHTTKTQDALFFHYYNKNDDLRITDLHQGIVWGTQTEETKIHENLINRFDYDGDYGTVLNRFLMQSVIGHPLTVHGKGGQTRAFIHISDTVKCIKLAIENPPQKNERVQIFNQATETYSVKELAEIIAKHTQCEIRYYKNPRKEDVENTLEVENKKFVELGLSPILLSKNLLEEIRENVEKYKDRCDLSKIICVSVWNRSFSVDTKGKAK